MFAGVGAVGRVGRMGLSSKAALVGRPSLVLDFMQPGILDSRITFSRASTATYTDASGTIQTAAINVPRFDYDPVTLQPKGLLIEDQRANIIFPSVPETLWGYSNTVVNVNAGIAPDGTNSMVKMTDQATNTYHCTTRTATITASQQYTSSVFLKRGEIRYVQVWVDNGVTVGYGAVFDLQNGVISGAISAAAGATAGLARIQPCGNGIYRCSVSGILAANTVLRLGVIHMATPAGTGFPSYLGVVGQGTFIWGAQVELSDFPTSYVPTTGVAVTRSPDVCSMADATWFTSPGGSWFCEFISVNPTPAASTRVIAPKGGTGVTPMFINASKLVGQSDGASVLTANALSTGAVTKAATVWASGQAKSCLNGGVVALSASLVTGYTTIAAQGTYFMGAFTVPADSTPGWLRRVVYWPRVLSDAEMQQVTT